MKFCTNCGAQIPDETKFCTECGQRVEASAPVQQPVYEEPVVPVQQPVHEAPAAPVQEPVYEAPAAPVQEPVHEAPAAPVQEPVYEAPAAPVQEPVYEAPAAPVQQPVYEAPPAPKAKAAGGKNKGLLIGGIAGAAVLIIALVVMLISGGADKNDPNLGMYQGVFCDAFGMTIDAEEDWLELKAGGKGTLCIMEDEIPIEWEIDDDELTLSVDDEEYEGTVENGVVILDMEGMVYTFAKEGAKVPTQPTTQTTTQPQESVVSYAGYWTLLRIDCDDPDYAMDEEMVSTLKDLGMEFFLDLAADGTGAFMFDSPLKVTWTEGKILGDDNGETVEMPCTLEDGQLKVVLENMTMVFVPGEGTAPAIDWTGAEATEPATEPTQPATEPATEPTEPATVGAYDWWEGSWYGWWVIWTAEGDFAEMEDDFWDAYAYIDVNDNTGSVVVWDSSMTDDEFLMKADVSFTSGVGEHGTMVAEEGEFLDYSFGHADWTVDSGANLVSEFENMIAIDGYYVDPENENNVIDYIIILRPWGMDWEDVRNGDTSQSLYSDMMPLYYDDWYMPLVNMGITEVPNSYEEGQAVLDSGESPTDAPTDPAASSSGVLASDSWEDCDIKIVGAEHFIDYEGKDAIRVYYEFTNTSDECQSAYGVIDWEFTQDGYELLYTYSSYDNEVPEEFNDGRQIQPGVTIRCSVEMTMKADGGPIIATIYDFWNEEDRLTVELDPANLPGAPKEPLVIPALMDPTMFANCASEGVYENDYYVVIENAETTVDYEGNTLIRVYFQFTNNSAEETSFGMNSILTLYQDGCSLDYGYSESPNAEEDSYYTDIAPGETIRVAVSYELRNESSPVEVVLEDWYTGENLAKIFVFE